tara:strand:+ start:227 stop:2098 length:1872 start_codon:yes stop_codon:yes gene_type:complete
MARLISYPTISTVASGDLFPVTDISDASKPLKNITAVNLQTFVNDGATLQRVVSTGNTYQASPSDALWTWGTSAITVTSTFYTSLLSGKRFKTTLIADGSYTDVLPNQIIFNTATGNETSITTNTALSSNIDLQWPSSSGTLALASDITASPWDTVTGGINYANGNVGIGTTTPSAKLDVNGDAKINGLTVGKGPGNLSQNVVLGVQALASNTTGNRNLAIGPEALEDNTTGSNNLAIGWIALQRNQTSSNNTAVGAGAIGLTQGGDNTAIGYAAGYSRVGGTNGSSVGSVFVGKSTTSNGLSSVNEIVIGTDAISAGSNTVVLGNDLITSTRLKGDVIVANGNVGIGTTSPSEDLDVVGTIRGETVFIKNTGGYNAKLISDSLTTNKTFQFPDAGGTIALTSDIPATSQWDDVTGGINYASGKVGIGTTSPSQKLHVSGITYSTNGYKLDNGSSISAFGTNSAIRFNNGNILVNSSVGTEYVRFDTANQRVGIGTTSPTANLDVTSTLNQQHLYVQGGYAEGVGALARIKTTGNGNVLLLESATASDSREILEVKNTNGTVFLVRGDGNVGIGTASPTSRLEVDGGDIEIDDSASGLILRSPDGTRYRITVANGGTLTVTAV